MQAGHRPAQDPGGVPPAEPAGPPRGARKTARLGPLGRHLVWVLLAKCAALLLLGWAIGRSPHRTAGPDGTAQHLLTPAAARPLEPAP